MNHQNLELSNIGGLDESICNAIGMNNNLEYSNLINENLLDGLTENTGLLSAADGMEDTYSNANYTPTSADIQAGADLTSTIVKATASKPDASGCKKPSMGESFFNRGKWSRYKDCVKNANDLAEKANAAERERTEQQRLKVEQARLGLEQLKRSRENSESSDKFLGMPKAVGITVTVVGGLALIVGGIFLVKKLRK